MSLTLTQLLSEVHKAHAERDDFTEDERIIALNFAQMRLARVQDWNELWSIDTGIIGDASDPATDKFEDIPSNIRKIYSFRIVDTASKQNSRKLEFTPQRQWDEEVPETEAWATGTPSQYTMWRRSSSFVFEFFKIPDESYNYEIRSSKWPTDFASGSPNAVSELDHKDDMLISLANSWGFLKFREMEEANRWWRIYREMLTNAVGEDMSEHEKEIVPAIVRATRRGLPSVEGWKDPFNRSSN